MVWSYVYLVVRNLFALVWLLARSRRANELDVLVLRHELAVLRRRAGRVETDAGGSRVVCTAGRNPRG